MKKGLLLLSVLGALGGLTAGCTQMPTEKQSVVDLRAQIAFKAEGERNLAAKVSIDGLPMGLVSEYLEGQAVLRILPGVHVLKVEAGGAALLEEKFYVGDGVTRSFVVR